MAQKIDSEQVQQNIELPTTNNPLVAASRQSPENLPVVRDGSVGEQAESPTPKSTVEITNISDVPVEDAIRAKLKGVSEVNIVVVGCFNMGKSTLINSLFFAVDQEYEEIAKEGSLAPCTMRKAKDPYVLRIDGVKYNIYDSPGLQDGKQKDLEILRWISQRHNKIHLAIYCTRMGEAVRPSEIKAMNNITTAFTKSIWNNTVIALTFANQVVSPRPNENLECYFKEKQKQKVKKLKCAFRNLSLQEDTLKKVTENIQPVGSASQLILPGETQDWRIDFWQGCLRACDPKAKGAIFQLAKSKKYFKAGSAGAAASTVSGIVGIVGGVGCMVAGTALTGTGILAPIGVPLLIGGAVGTVLGAGATAGGFTNLVTNSKVKKEETMRNKQVDEEIEEHLEGDKGEMEDSLKG